MDPKKPNLPLPSAGQNFLWPFEDEVCQKPKKSRKFLQKMIKTSYCLYSLERKLFVDYKNVVGFCFCQ